MTTRKAHRGGGLIVMGNRHDLISRQAKPKVRRGEERRCVASGNGMVIVVVGGEGQESFPGGLRVAEDWTILLGAPPLEATAAVMDPEGLTDLWRSRGGPNSFPPVRDPACCLPPTLKEPPMSSIWSRCFAIFGLVLAASCTAQGAVAQDALIDFEKDVKPILEQHCYRCHGGESTEGLDLNDTEARLDYVTPGDPEGSDFFQRLVATDDTLMPPADEGTPLAKGEIAVLKLWISEGAKWPATIQLGATSAVPVPSEPAAAGPKPHEKSTAAKLWAIHGWFHPAVVHFPVALLNVAALFVLLHWVFRGAFREMAFWCLLLGAISSIVACSMGWAFVSERYLSEEEVFRHRWGGIAVAVWSSLISILALRLKSSDKGWSQIGWQLGVLVAAAGVGIVGHQGGELVYGEGMYDKVFLKYFPGTAATAPVEASGAASEKDAAGTGTSGDMTSGDTTSSGETPATESPDTAAPTTATPPADSKSSEESAPSAESVEVETPATDPPAAEPVDGIGG